MKDINLFFQREANPFDPLAHLCRVDSATLTVWTGPFAVKGVCG